MGCAWGLLIIAHAHAPAGKAGAKSCTMRMIQCYIACTSLAQALEVNKLKEIKNGRLAMIAFVGFVAQHAATGKVCRSNQPCNSRVLVYIVQPWQTLQHPVMLAEGSASCHASQDTSLICNVGKPAQSGIPVADQC